MTNREGQTALHFAAEMGRMAVVRFLLDRGASPLIADAAGRTPIDAARGHDEVRALLEAGQAR
jgi:ankyrin repeat protein